MIRMAKAQNLDLALETHHQGLEDWGWQEWWAWKSQLEQAMCRRETAREEKCLARVLGEEIETEEDLLTMLLVKL